MNKVILIGNITHDLELKEPREGIKVCCFSIAVTSIRNGEKVVEFFNIVTWRGQAENVHKYCKKGSKVAVIGELRIEVYEDSEGIKRTAVKVNAQEIEFLSTGNTDKSVEEKEALQPPKTEKKAVLQPVEDDDDIPF